MTWTGPMVARSPTETHRAATPLELLFDLVLVVAIAFAASSLHHALEEGHVEQVIVSYAMVSFAIWALDQLHVVRLRLRHRRRHLSDLVFVQMTGALVVATEVPQLFEALDRSVVLIGRLPPSSSYGRPLSEQGVLLVGIGHAERSVSAGELGVGGDRSP